MEAFERALGLGQCAVEAVVMFGGAYDGKTVLITGHTGFKGSWLTMWLLRLGAHVAGYALEPPTSPSLFRSCGLSSLIDHTEADVRDGERLRATVAGGKPDYIFHLAAQPLVRDSYLMPVETYEINVMGTINLLDAVRREGHACSIVVVSSDKCYENREWEYGYRELDRLGGHDPYSASKAAMEVAVASYRSSYFNSGKVRVATARAGNVIGGGDWSSDRIVPDAIRSLQEGTPLAVRHSAAVRPWQHVLEPLGGYLLLGAALMSPSGEALTEAWNFGPTESDTRCVAELADAVIAAWGEGRWQRQDDVDSAHEARILRLCIDKARASLDWRPVWDFDTAVSRSVNWYRTTRQDDANSEIAYQACLNDIRAYEDAAREMALAWTR